MDRAYHYHRIEKGMECEGIKIAVFTRYMSDKLASMTNNDELDIIETHRPYPPIYGDKTEYTGNVFVPYPYRDTATARAYVKHAERVVEIIRGGATKAKIYVFELYSDYALKWCADNGVFITNTSWTNDGISEKTKLEAYNKGLLMFTSAGNEGRKDNPDLTTLAKSELFTAIGSVHIKYNLKLPDGSYDLDRYYELYPPDYASEGEELDFCAVGRMLFADGTYGNGSSFASPMAVLMLVQMADRFLNYFGYLPDRGSTDRFISRNITDLLSHGFDIETGDGVLRLPLDFDKDFVNQASNIWEIYVIMYFGKGGLGKERRERMLEFDPDYWIKEKNRVEQLLLNV